MSFNISNYEIIGTGVSWSQVLRNGKAYVTVSPVVTSISGADYGPDTPGTTTSGIQEAIYSGYNVKLLPGVFVVSSTINLVPNIEVCGTGLQRIIGGAGDTTPTNPFSQVKNANGFTGSIWSTNAPTTGTSVNQMNIYLHDITSSTSSTTAPVYDLNNSDTCVYERLFANGGSIGFQLGYNNTSTAPSDVQVPGASWLSHCKSANASQYGFLFRSLTQMKVDNLYVVGTVTKPTVAFELEGINTSQLNNLLAQEYSQTGMDINYYTYLDGTKSSSFNLYISGAHLIGGSGKTGLNANNIKPTQAILINGLHVSTNEYPVINAANLNIFAQA
jgi:hypothetical protein